MKNSPRKSHRNAPGPQGRPNRPNQSGRSHPSGRSSHSGHQSRSGHQNRSGHQSHTGHQGHSRHQSHQPTHQPASGGAIAHNGHVEGLLQVPDERQDGQLRDPAFPLRLAKGNLVVPRQMIRDLQLRPGLLIKGISRGHTLGQIESIEGRPVDEYGGTTPLYDATALDPQPMLKLEHDPAEVTSRVIDILTPVGFGQRGLIVAPPRTGKTILLQNIARGVHANYPNALLWLLLIDERPEEVTDMKRNVPGTVYASSNDNTVEKHLDLAQLIIERAKRLVEFGKDVVIMLDSLTRLGRSFNVGGQHQTGRTLSGGLDARALEIPKRLFGAARKVENGGSLTIIATCLVDTGSRMDQVIFEEFKGTGNMELTLDRNLANARIYPAINITESGTRKEEKLLDERTLAATRTIRRHLLNMPPTQAMKNLVEALGKHPTNESLFKTMKA
jgi:transcription termination factor Rho